MQNSVVFKCCSREPWRTLKVPQELPNLGRAVAGLGGKRMENREAEHSSLFLPSTLLQSEQAYFCMLNVSK